MSLTAGLSTEEQALDLLASRPLVVLTGAGLSTDSGIPDYRGKGAPARAPMTYQEFVATPEAHRGHGYGGAVTGHAVEQARAAGARGAYLQSSPMGLPVYERLGFVPVETWRQWMPAQFTG